MTIRSIPTQAQPLPPATRGVPSGVTARATVPPGRRAALALAGAAALALSGCSALPDRPTRPTLYDFGPGPIAPQAADRRAPLPTLVLGAIEPAGVADTTAVHYRFAYTNAQQLRPYALARWSMPPPQLVRQRLRETLGQRRAVLNEDDSASLQRTGGRAPRILRLQLEEFSQVFTAPGDSVGVLRLRATLVDNTAGGERLVAQRQLVVQRPAPTADAPGGVQALSAATDAAAEELAAWLEQAAS